MKWKRPIIGILLYLGLFAILTATAVFNFMVIFPPFSETYLLITASGALFCGGFILKAAKKASILHLTISLLVFYMVNIAIVVLNPIMTLTDSSFILIPLVIMWLICASGIGVAKWATSKWSTPKARRIMAWLSPIPVLLVCVSFYLFELSCYLHSGIESQQLGNATLQCNATELQSTQVVPDLGTPITPGSNLIWCAPFQLAWNEILELIGEDIRFYDNEPASVHELNQRAVTKQYLDSNTYLSFAGKYTPQFVQGINKEIENKFGRESFTPEQAPESDGQKRLAAFGYLKTNLPFKDAFERSETPMDFKGIAVESFTIPFSLGSNERAEKAKRQVRVLYPPEENSYIVELLTRETDHHLTLARIAPEATLAATVDKVCRYIDTLPRKNLEENQELEVPLFNFDITKEYEQLTHQPLFVENPDYRNWIIERAGQNIRFQLDERGATLRSSSLICCVICMPPVHCIFDQPFLLMLRYRDHPKPYFAMWVDNAEILVKAE